MSEQIQIWALTTLVQSLEQQVRGLSKSRADIMRNEIARQGGKASSITCEDCGLNGTCEFAWDLYNTDGDCLAEK